MTDADAPARRGRPPEPWRGQRILAAAQRLFAERGFHAVSVDEIGRAAGTTGAALYRYFTSKQDLLVTLLNDVQARYLTEMPPPQADARRELSELLHYQLTMVAANRELASIWTQQHHVLDDARLADYAAGERVYFERWTDCLARCCPGLEVTDCRDVGRAVIEMTNFLAASPTHEAGERELELVRRVLDAGLGILADSNPGDGPGPPAVRQRPAVPTEERRHE